jgi:hypothetical protein
MATDYLTTLLYPLIFFFRNHKGEAAGVNPNRHVVESAAQALAHSKSWFTTTSDMQPTGDLGTLVDNGKVGKVHVLAPIHNPKKEQTEGAGMPQNGN